ncbi:MAG: hypothetical protein CMK09_16490 [Ponticaulis sp.]|nr:hypothetical protein [Ponticaulis sp.]|tara:strand:+ start:13576 stop:15165 length:1590 start_codon:yes stop_codon:yes gene_type:complete
MAQCEFRARAGSKLNKNRLFLNDLARVHMIDFREIKDLLRLHIEDEPLLRAQLDAMERQVPLLYLILLISIVAQSFFMRHDAPAVLTVLFPAMVALIIGYRLFAWANRSRGEVPIDMVIRKLRILVGVAVVVTLLFCGWAALMARHTSDGQMAYIAVFSVITILATVFSLAPLGLAAIVGVVIGAITMLSTSVVLQNDTLLGVAIWTCCILVVVVALLGRWNKSFISDVHSREALRKLNSETQALNDELKAHKSHLEDLVELRTHELAQQALKLEEALQAERKLNQMQNEFVSMVSHEFRTPLAIIDGSARRVERKSDSMSDEDIGARMAKIRGSVTRLSSLVERTLDASRLASGCIRYEPDWYDPIALIHEVVDRQRDVTTDYEFDLQLNTLPETVFGDRRLMDLVVSNIISNAVKYSPEVRKICLFTSVDAAGWHLIVRDHGVGIPQAELAKVTERFFRASTASGIQGTGIGLNLVKQLVAMHNGRMTIDSQVGEWTEVSLQLPVKAPEAAIETAEPLVESVERQVV